MRCLSDVTSLSSKPEPGTGPQTHSMKRSIKTHWLKQISHLNLSRNLIALRFGQLLAMLALVLAMAESCWSQGEVMFQNSAPFNTEDPSGGSRLVYSNGADSFVPGAIGNGLSGTQFVAELYAGADAASLTPVTASISRFRP